MLFDHDFSLCVAFLHWAVKWSGSRQLVKCYKNLDYWHSYHGDFYSTPSITMYTVIEAATPGLHASCFFCTMHAVIQAATPGLHASCRCLAWQVTNTTSVLVHVISIMECLCGMSKMWMLVQVYVTNTMRTQARHKHKWMLEHVMNGVHATNIKWMLVHTCQEHTVNACSLPKTYLYSIHPYHRQHHRLTRVVNRLPYLAQTMDRSFQALIDALLPSSCTVISSGSVAAI